MHNFARVVVIGMTFGCEHARLCNTVDIICVCVWCVRGRVSLSVCVCVCMCVYSAYTYANVQKYDIFYYDVYYCEINHFAA